MSVSQGNRRQCRFCRFADDPDDIEALDEEMFCRRYAPRPSFQGEIRRAGSPTKDQDEALVWPIVWPLEWCGEFEDREDRFRHA